MNFNQQIAERIKAEMKECGVTVEELSKKTGISKRRLQKYLRGEYKRKTLWFLVTLCQTLNVSTDKILGLAHPKKKPLSSKESG